MNKAAHLALLVLSYGTKRLRPFCPPWHYSIESTNICNLKCVFCPQSNPAHAAARPRGFLTVDNFRFFLERRKEAMPGSGIINMTLDGEPLLNKDFAKFIYYANQEGLLPKFSTNGLLLTKDKIQELVSMGDFSVAVDFASDAKYFENIRGSREDYFAILENLRFMFEAAKKNRKIKLEIDDISNFAGPGIKESLDSMKSLFPEHAASNIVFNSRDFHNFCGHLPLNKKNARYEVCVYPWVAFDVTWNGDVVSCCRDTEARTVLGNVFKESVKDIWYGDRYIELRRNLIEKCPDKIKACKGCDMPYSGRINYFKIANALSFLFRR